MAMAMATLSLAPSSLRLHPTPTPTKPSPSTATNLLNVTSLRLQTSRLVKQSGRSLKSRWCQAGSVDKNNDTASVEPKAVDETKDLSSGSKKQGPPFLTIIAGIVVAALVVWGLWSVVSAILRVLLPSP